MILGLDFYDTITAWPTQLRKLADAVHKDGGEVHVVSAVKAVNVERVNMQFKDARMPYATLHILIYSDHADLPALKVPKYHDLRCDLIVDDNPGVIALARASRLCALQIGGFSDNPIVKYS
jgi:hypothetical protein